MLLRNRRQVSEFIVPGLNKQTQVVALSQPLKDIKLLPTEQERICCTTSALGCQEGKASSRICCNLGHDEIHNNDKPASTVVADRGMLPCLMT